MPSCAGALQSQVWPFSKREAYAGVDSLQLSLSEKGKCEHRKNHESALVKLPAASVIIFEESDEPGAW